MYKKELDPARFKLKLIKETEPKILKSGNKRRYALFECPECKKQFITSVASAYRSSTCKSCAVRRNNTKHGLSYNRLYHIWCGIIQRCCNKEHWQYPSYGGKGITICDEWLNSPQKFIDYVSKLDNYNTPRYSLDRIENTEGYKPGNVRWADSITQSHNSKKGFWGESKYVGVVLQRSNDKWKAILRYKNKAYHLGVYEDEKEAAITYDNKIDELQLTKLKNKDVYPNDFI